MTIKFKKGDKVITRDGVHEGKVSGIALECGDPYMVIELENGYAFCTDMYGVDDDDYHGYDIMLLSEYDKPVPTVEKPVETNDIKNPSHYKLLDDIEAIDVIKAALTAEEWRGYCLGNIIKYRLRAGNKDDALKDIGKADEYKLIFGAK